MITAKLTLVFVISSLTRIVLGFQPDVDLRLNLNNNNDIVTEISLIDKSVSSANLTDSDSKFEEYLPGYFTRGFSQPINSKNLTVNLVSSLEEIGPQTYLWWAVAIWRIADRGMQLRQLYNSCRDWSQGKNNKIDCVWGSIATAIDLGVVSSSLYKGYLTLGTRLTQNALHVPGVKREYNDIISMAEEANSMLSDAIGRPTAMLYNSFMLPVLNDQTNMPVHIIQMPDGGLHHYSVMKANGTHNVFRLATSHSSQQLAKRDEQFNLENFSSGGIESGFYRHESQSVANLDTNNDFGQMDHEVSCECDLNDHAYQYIVWDYNHNSALSSGWFHGYQYDPYDDMQAEIFPYPGSNPPGIGNCYVS